VSPVLDPELLARRRPSTSERLRVAVAAVAALAALAALASAFRAPAFTDRVTVVNESPFDLHVTVQGEDGDMLGLGTVPRDRSVEYRSVLDQGDTWSFIFAASGEAGGTVEVARSSLERDGWTLTVPAVVTQRLERAGLPASPRTRAG
jgi:hypothetical protein